MGIGSHNDLHPCNDDIYHHAFALLMPWMMKSCVQDPKVCSWRRVVVVPIFLYIGWSWRAELGVVAAGRVDVDDVRGVHDEG